MTKLKASGLPIFMDEQHKLHFADGLACAGGGGKTVAEMRGLLMDERDINESEAVYDFYRDIVFEKERGLFNKYGLRYDITVIMPGGVNGECKKTSGHYHGLIAGRSETYPEVYEVLYGRACFLLQKVRGFNGDGMPQIEDLRAVFVPAGQAVIIPPHYAHCSVNAGGGPMVFSNIAVTACPLDYDNVKKLHGMAAYITRKNGDIRMLPNPYYQNAPLAAAVTPKENAELGIEFGKPVYHAFINAPEKFEFLLCPWKYPGQMERMTEESSTFM